MHRRTLGITVLADFILSEGVDAVLDNVVGRAGATAVACGIAFAFTHGFVACSATYSS